jgi:hypothetical protein
MKKLPIVFIVILISTFFSCSTHKVADEFPYGSYSYQSFNIVGELIGDGSLFISTVDSNIIEGNWSIRNIRNCIVCGPQYGSGYLTGRIENDSVYVNLNPNNPENYVELVGKVDGDNFSGDWRWFKLIVNSNRGTFEAVKE